MTRIEEAKKWLREELERLRRAPDLNGCPMTQEWAEQIRVFTVALEAIEAQGDWLCKKPCTALLDEGVCAHGGICEANRIESDTVKGVEIYQFNADQHVSNTGNALKDWISVEDRLPPGMADVLVVAFWHERWQTMIGWCRKAEEEWRVYTSHGEVRPGGVTHWMPLPEFPKEDT